MPLWNNIKQFIQDCKLNYIQPHKCIDVENDIWITYSGTSSKQNKYTFLITRHFFAILTMIRVEHFSKNEDVWATLANLRRHREVPSEADEKFRVLPGLVNIEFTLNERPHIWYRKINDSWILSEEYDRLREKKGAVMRNIEEIGITPPLGSFPGGGQYLELIREHLRNANTRTPEQVAANLRKQYHEAERYRQDPLSGAYLALTEIKKVTGGHRRTRRKQQRRRKSKSKSQKRR